MDAKIYAELSRRASELECMISKYFNKVEVTFEGKKLGTVLDDGIFVTKDKCVDTEHRNSAYFKVQNLIDNIYEYVNAYKNGDVLYDVDIPNGYRILSSYNNVMFAAKEMDRGGYQFVTWDLDEDRMGVHTGNYTTDYIFAKSDFVTRAGLMDKNKVFNDEELKAIYSAVDYALNECSDRNPDLTNEFDKVFAKLKNILFDGNEHEQNKGFELNI